MAAAVNQLAGHDSIGENPAVAVNVFEKKIQCGNALREAAFNLLPFVVGDDARQQVVGKNALRAFIISIHREGDALVQK